MTLSKLFVASLILGCAPVAAHAAGKTPTNPVALTTLDYSQNFDGLAASGTGNSALPDGFQIVETGSGSAADGFYRAGSGSSNAGDVYSFGNSADRALGSLASGSNDAIYFGAIFINRLDRIISDLRFAYTGEQWRAGSSNDDGLIFQLSMLSRAPEDELAAQFDYHWAFAEPDFRIWEHKIHRTRPLLCEEDGPIARFRGWAAQFY